MNVFHVLLCKCNVVTMLVCQYSVVRDVFSSRPVMGKAEGHADNWHGHVTAVSVAPEYRKLGLAAQLMNTLEDVSERWEVM